MTEINETVTVKVLPTTMVEMDIYELKKILKRRLKTIKGLGKPYFDSWESLRTRMQCYQRYSANIKSISAALYAMQNLLEDYINQTEKELEKQKAKIDSQAESCGEVMQETEEDAEQ